MEGNMSIIYGITVPSLLVVSHLNFSLFFVYTLLIQYLGVILFYAMRNN